MKKITLKQLFVECDSCIVKPGMPILCNGCLHNRRVISIMNEIIEKKERAERKALWIARATAHFDSPQIRRQAAAMFEKKNAKTK